jgi:hypothetical protein
VTGDPQRTLALQTLGSAVLLQGPAVADAAYLVAVALRTLAGRDGVAPMPRWLTLQAQLKRASDLVADDGSEEVPEARHMPPLTEDQLINTREAADMPPLTEDQLINTREAADMLKITERQVRNLAADLGARRAGRALVFSRELVRLEASRRVNDGAA